MGLTLTDVYREIQRLRADARPIARIDLGMADWADLRRGTPFVTDTAARESRIYGVPFVVRPLERAFRIVEGENGPA